MSSSSLHPWFLSLEVAAAATLINLIVGLPLAYVLARRRFPGRSLVESFVILPLVLPPTAVGFLLMFVIGRHGLVGFITGHSFLFSIPAAILASSVVSLPLLVMPAKAAFASIDREYLEEARLCGLSSFQIFRHIALPLTRRGLLAGMLLCFARAVGEFGATLMLVGTAERTRTLPIQIYLDAGVTDDFLNAWPAVIALSLTSMTVILIANHLKWLDAEKA